MEDKQDDSLEKTSKAFEKLKDPKNKFSDLDLTNLTNEVERVNNEQDNIEENIRSLNDK